MAVQHSSPSFGESLRELRERHGLTQADLSKASGISQSTVSALEAGKQRPWPSTRRALAAAFDMSLEDFDHAVLPQRQAAFEPTAWDAAEAPADDDTRSQYSEMLLRVVEQLHHTEDRLRRADRELGLIRRMIDRMPVLQWETDSNLQIVRASGWEAKRLDAWADLVGRNLEDLHQAAESGDSAPGGGDSLAPLPLDAHRDAMSGRTVFRTIEWQGVRWEVVIEPLRDARGSVTGLLGLAVADVLPT